MPARLLVRNPRSLPGQIGEYTEVVTAEVTRPETLRGVMQGVGTVISTIGITRQKDGLTYMDVDYRANRNLLDAASAAGVSRFVYVSVLNGDSMRELKICEAKERFVDELKTSGISYAIIRPNGFFSDLSAFVEMARRGRVYVFGDGSTRANPIHGADLADVCVDAVTGVKSGISEIEVGDPEILSQREIADLAFSAVGKKPHILAIPDAVRRAVMKLARVFTSSKTYGPLEFFLSVMARDMIAPAYGSRTIAEFYREICSDDSGK